MSQRVTPSAEYLTHRVLFLLFVFITMNLWLLRPLGILVIVQPAFHQLIKPMPLITSLMSPFISDPLFLQSLFSLGNNPFFFLLLLLLLLWACQVLYQLFWKSKVSAQICCVLSFVAHRHQVDVIHLETP